ncbi:MAG TPA: hypothetical protein VFU31_00895 [Candidatus Binatia bacterium]|nr:hypothetical protein [Candidatus Binatia bacterium]
MKPERFYQSLLHTLQENEVRRLTKCLEEIDQKLLDCRKSLEEYQRARLALDKINEHLSRLRAKRPPMTEQLPTPELQEIIKSGIEHFKSSGKI